MIIRKDEWYAMGSGRYPFQVKAVSGDNVFGKVIIHSAKRDWDCKLVDLSPMTEEERKKVTP